MMQVSQSDSSSHSCVESQSMFPVILDDEKQVPDGQCDQEMTSIPSHSFVESQSMFSVMPDDKKQAPEDKGDSGIKYCGPCCIL